MKRRPTPLESATFELRREKVLAELHQTAWTLILRLGLDVPPALLRPPGPRAALRFVDEEDAAELARDAAKWRVCAGPRGG
jgi:hypothetical protein